MAKQQDPNDLEKLYKVVSEKFDIGDYNSFTSKMQTTEDRQKFYEVVSGKGYDLGDYNKYEERLGKQLGVPQGSESTSQTSTEPLNNSQGQSLSRPDILNNIYKKFPNMKKMGEVTLLSDNKFTRDFTGSGDIETFLPTSDEIYKTTTYPTGNKLRTPNENTVSIVYNPETNNEQNIMLDMLHGMVLDQEYNSKREDFKKAYLNSKYGIELDNAWLDYNKETNGDNDGKANFIENEVDGVIRNLLFEGSEEDFEKSRYWKDAKKEYFKNGDIKEKFNNLLQYLQSDDSLNNYKSLSADNRGLGQQELGDTEFQIEGASGNQRVAIVTTQENGEDIETYTQVLTPQIKRNYLQNLENSLNNNLSQFKGIDERLQVTGGAIAKKILGQTNIEALGQFLDVDITEAIDGAYVELDRLRAKGQEVGGFTDGEVASGLTDAVLSLVYTGLVSQTTGGVALFTDMVGGSIAEANQIKADRLGLSVKDLYSQNKEDFFAPAILGGLSFGLERIGLKGVKQAMSRKMSGGLGRTLGMIGFDINKEGMTEWVQYGFEGVNEYLAEGGDPNASGISEVFADRLASKEGLEQYLKGVAGSGVLASPNIAVSTLSKNENRGRALELDKERRTLITELETPSVMNSPIAREAVLNKIEKLTSEITEIVDADFNETKMDLPIEQVEEVSVLASEITDLQQQSEVEGISDEVKSALVEQQEVLQTQIDEITGVQESEVFTEPEQGEIVNEEGSSNTQKPLNTTDEVETELLNIPDDETRTFTVSSLENVPEPFRDRARRTSSVGNTEVYKTILGVPYGKPIQSTNIDNYTYEASGAEIKRMLVDGSTAVDIETATDATIVSPELQTEIQSDTSFWEDLTNTEARQSRIQTLRERLGGNNNLGIAQDPLNDAKWMRDATELAILSIVDGTVKSAKALGQVLGLSTEQAQPIYNDAIRLSEGVINNPDRQRPVKSRIREATQGGVQGSVTMTERQALASQINTLNRGAKNANQNTKDISSTINAYIEANKPRLKGAKIPSSIIGRVSRAVSGVVSEKQLARSLDTLERVIDNTEFRAKLAKIDSYQGAIKRAVRGANVPSDLRRTAREFADINVNDLDVDKLDEYLTMLDSISRIGFRDNSITAERMNEIIELANENAEVRKNEKALNANTMEAQELRNQRQIDNLEKGLREKGLDDSDIKILSNDTLSLAERIDNLTEKKEELTVSKETQLRQNAERGFNDVIDNLADITVDMSSLQKDILNDFVSNLNIAKLPKNYLKALNFVLDNINNNYSITGTGLFINIGKWQNTLENTAEVNATLDVLITPERFNRFLMKYVTGGSLNLTSIVDNVSKNMGKVLDLIGFNSLETNSIRASNRWKKEVLDKEIEFFKKYQKDFSRKQDWMRMDLYALSRQIGLTDAIMRLARSYEQMDEAFRENSLSRNRNQSYFNKYKQLLDEVATYDTNDKGEIVLESIKVTEEDLFNMSPKGLQEYYNFARDWSGRNENDFFAVIESFENKVNDRVPNYLPISYINLEESEISSNTNRASSGMGKSLRAPTSTASIDRVIQGSGVPRGKALAFGDMLMNFSEHAGEMLNDIYTLGDRKYSTIALDYRNNGITDIANEGTDFAPFEVMKLAFESKAEGDLLQYRSGAGNEFNVIKSIGRTLSNLGSVMSLNTIAQVLKQSTPVFHTLAVVKNPMSVFRAFQLISKGDPATVNLLSEANIVKRDIAKTYGNFGRQGILENESDELVSKFTKDVFQGIEGYVTEKSLMKRYFNNVMVKPDLYWSKAVWLSLYLDNATQNGNVAPFVNPDTDSIAYANRVSSNISNESDASMASKLSQNTWVKMLFPFMSFAFNSRSDLLMSIGKLRKARTKAGRIEASRMIAGNLFNLTMFHVISDFQARMVLMGASNLSSALVESLYDDDEDDKLKEMLENISEQSKALSDRNTLNRIQYFLTDILTGGVLQDQIQPIVGGLLQPIYEEQLGKQRLKDSGFNPLPYKQNVLKGTLGEEIAGAIGQFGGTAGIGLEKLVQTGLKLGAVPVSNEKYNKDLRGFIGADGTVRVEQMYLDPENADQYGVPKWYQGAFALDAFLSTVASTIVSDQVVTSTMNRTVSMLKKLHKEEVGAIKTEKQLEKLIEQRKSFDSINLNGTKIDVTADDATELYNLFLEEVEREYTKTPFTKVRSGFTLEEYEDKIYSLAKVKAEMNFLKDKRGMVKDANIKKQEQVKEEMKLKRMLINYNRDNG